MSVFSSIDRRPIENTAKRAGGAGEEVWGTAAYQRHHRAALWPLEIRHVPLDHVPSDRPCFQEFRSGCGSQCSDVPPAMASL